MSSFSGRKLAESSACSVTRALREAASVGGRSANGATLYLALGNAELDRGELVLLREIAFDRAHFVASAPAAARARALALGVHPTPVVVEISPRPEPLHTSFER